MYCNNCTTLLKKTFFLFFSLQIRRFNDTALQSACKFLKYFIDKFKPFEVNKRTSKDIIPIAILFNIEMASNL